MGLWTGWVSGMGTGQSSGTGAITGLGTRKGVTTGLGTRKGDSVMGMVATVLAESSDLVAIVAEGSGVVGHFG